MGPDPPLVMPFTVTVLPDKVRLEAGTFPLRYPVPPITAFSNGTELLIDSATKLPAPKLG